MLLSRIVDVRPGEAARVLRMFALLGLIIATNYVLKPVRSALFLSQFGSSQLPYVYIAVAVFLGVVAAAFARFGPRANLPRFIVGISCFFSFNLMLFWLAALRGWSLTGFVFYVWVSTVIALLPSVFWLLANYVFYAHEGRRLFPVVMAGGLSGSIFGGGATSLLVPLLGTTGMMPLAALLFLSIALLTWITASRERERMSERRADLRRQERSRSSPADESPYRLLARSRYLTRVAALVLLTSLVSTLVDYQFNSVVEKSFATEDALTRFFGAFFAAINVLAFTLQLAFSGRILSRLGVGAGLLVLPLGLLGSSFSFVLVPSLFTASLLKTADDGLSNSMNRASLEVLYLPLALSVKNRLKIWIDLFVERVSRGLGGLVILGATALGSLTAPDLGYAVLALLVPWILLVLSLRREYVATLRASLARRDISDLDSALRDPASRGVFRQILTGSDAREIAYALSLVQGIDDPEMLDEVSRLASHESPQVRAAALRVLQAAPEPVGIEGIEKRVSDEDPAVGAEALALWLRLDPEKARERCARLVEEGDVRRISAVLDCLEGRRTPADAPLALLVARHGSSSSAAERRLAAKALGFVPPDAEAEGLLLKLLEDSDVEAARAAALSSGKHPSEHVFDALVKALARRPLRAQVRRSIAGFGPDAVPKLQQHLRDPGLHPAARRAIPRAIAEIEDPRSVEALFRILPAEDPRLHYQGVKGLARLRAHGRSLRFPRAEADRLLTCERDSLLELARLEASISKHRVVAESHRLLIQVLNERIEYTRERMFRLLGLTYRQDEIASLWSRVVSGPPSVKAAALEYLANLLSRTHRVTLFPAIEQTTRLEAGRLREATASSEVATVPFVEALKLLSESRDYWIAACAVTVIGELGLASLRMQIESLRAHPGAIVREAALRASTLAQNGTRVT
jgi:AAA family ATP:ADP antiporter